jgi:hypothetical protein
MTAKLYLLPYVIAGFLKLIYVRARDQKDATRVDMISAVFWKAI